MPVKVTIYTREGCCLCDDAHAALERVRRQAPFDLEIVDIDGDPDLGEKYGTEIPVVLVDGKKVAKYRVDETALLRRLAASRGTPPPSAQGGSRA
jgi:glutaredoxin